MFVSQPQTLAKLCFFWGVGVPLALLGSMKIVPWFGAVQYYGLPFLFLSHFIFVVAAMMAYRGMVKTARWTISFAAIVAIASGVMAILLIGSINPPNTDPGDLTMIRVALYAVYGLYIAGNAYVTVSAFKCETVVEEATA